MLHRSRLLSRVDMFIWLLHVGEYGFEDKLDLYSIEGRFDTVNSGLKAAWNQVLTEGLRDPRLLLGTHL